MVSGVPEFLRWAEDLELLVLSSLWPGAVGYKKWGEILLGGRDFVPWDFDLGAAHGPVGIRAKGAIVPRFLLRNLILPFKEASHGATCATSKDSYGVSSSKDNILVVVTGTAGGVLVGITFFPFLSFLVGNLVDVTICSLRSRVPIAKVRKEIVDVNNALGGTKWARSSRDRVSNVRGILDAARR